LDFRVRRRPSNTKKNYDSEIVEIAYKFTKEIHTELKDFLKAVILFGSSARKKQDANDIDILLIVDDVSMDFSPEMVQAYRIIVENTVAKVSTLIHVTSMKFSSFWEYVRAGDPIAINVLRDGYALIDSGFFDPMQLLLHQGRVKPTPEALWAYFNRAPRTLKNSKKRILEACVDLYWAVIDAAHAALMYSDEIPPSPDHVADLMEDKLVKKKLLDKKYPWTMRKFYTLSKDILAGRRKEVSGPEYDALFKEAEDFVDAMKKYIQN